MKMLAIILFQFRIFCKNTAALPQLAILFEFFPLNGYNEGNLAGVLDAAIKILRLRF